MNSVSFHHVREVLAFDEWRTTYINTHENVVDLMTKNLPAGAKTTKFCEILLRYLYPSTIEEESSNEAAAAAAVRVLLADWIEGIVGAVDCWDVERRNKV